MILVGVDGKGNDLAKGLLCEFCFPCPPYCSDSNALTG